MMRVASTEVQNSFGKYLDIVSGGKEIIVTKNGKDIIKMISCGDENCVAENASVYTTEKRKISYEEFIEITENSDLRYELIDGEIINLASPNYQHQYAVAEILTSFHNWFKGKKCRPLTSPFDVNLLKGEENKNVVQPDIIVICDTENIDEKGKYKGIPTLVVEILSGSTRRYDMIKKLDLYMQTGIKEYWIVDPDKKGIYLYNFEDQDINDFIVYTGDKIVKSNVFQGLEVGLTGIFSN